MDAALTTIEPTPQDEPPRDAALLERFRRRRDESAFRALYRECTPRLYALALRLLAGAAGEAQELVQETWVRAVERLDRFRGDSRLSTWLAGILVNCYRERGRRAARDPLPLDEAREPAVETSGTRRTPADPMDVERAIAALPDGYREVLVLFDLNGYSHREIASLLGIDVGTSKSQLARGRARLRQWLLAPPADDTRGAR